MYEFLMSDLWDLFFVSLTLLMMSAAYYSRNHEIQAIALYIFVTYIIYLASSLNLYVAVVIDSIGLLYSIIVWRRDLDNAGIMWIGNTFVLMLMIHWLRQVDALLVYYIALNALYAAQLFVLIGYSRKYGKAARGVQVERNDPFYRAAVWCRIA